MRIRIIVANIQSGIGVTKNYRQYLTSGWRYLLPHRGRGILDAGTFLKAEDTDIALLTEVDGGSRRSRHVSQMDRIKDGSGLSQARFFSTRLVGTSINEGNAVLTRFPIVSDRAYPLASRVNPRVLGETVLDLPDGRSLTALVAHLALGARQRELQLAEIAEHVKKLDGPLMLGGDFNERDHHAFRHLKKAGLAPISVAGYPSWKPVHALQVLFLSHHFTGTKATVPDGARFSDHLPLIVETELD
jgi:endonuclease/exonuclease/phosphatase family metal-dependent hydrolase